MASDFFRALSPGSDLDEEMDSKGNAFDPDDADTKFRLIDATPNYYYSEESAAAIASVYSEAGSL